MAYEGIDFVPSVAFEPNWFDQTLGYLAERAEDGIQLGVLGVAGMALFASILGAAVAIRAAGRAAGGRGRAAAG